MTARSRLKSDTDSPFGASSRRRNLERAGASASAGGKREKARQMIVTLKRRLAERRRAIAAVEADIRHINQRMGTISNSSWMRLMNRTKRRELEGNRDKLIQRLQALKSEIPLIDLHLKALQKTLANHGRPEPATGKEQESGPRTQSSRSTDTRRQPPHKPVSRQKARRASGSRALLGDAAADEDRDPTTYRVSHMRGKAQKPRAARAKRKLPFAPGDRESGPGRKLTDRERALLAVIREFGMIEAAYQVYHDPGNEDPVWKAFKVS